VVSGADYNFTEKLLPENLRNYSDEYWSNRKMAPSCLLYYVGLNKKLPDEVTHHTLFFDGDFQSHSDEIYRQPQMPTNPLFYMCCPSKTDESVAPNNHENVFLLIPIAAGLENDDEQTREKYFQQIVKRIEERYGTNITANIVHKRSFSVRDFKSEYNSFKGNAYGLANTLMQTAILKPKIKSKKVNNLYFTGQLTVPGPGVPPALISGEVVAKYILKTLKK
jgi:phytoene desaturase